jgi:hypothetical protein
MSHPSKSLFAFGCYLVLVGVTLLLVPNLLLGLFRLPLTTEVWIRVVGMLVLARLENRLFMQWSVWLRGSVILFFGAFVLAGLASPALLLFGAVDFAGALWTWSALRKDAARA